MLAYTLRFDQMHPFFQLPGEVLNAPKNGAAEANKFKRAQLEERWTVEWYCSSTILSDPILPSGYA